MYVSCVVLWNSLALCGEWWKWLQRWASGAEDISYKVLQNVLWEQQTTCIAYFKSAAVIRPDSNLGKVLSVCFGSTTIKNTEVERKNIIIIIWSDSF